MEESTTYQLLLNRGRAEGEANGEAKGRTEEARDLLLRLGRKRFGEPDNIVHHRLSAMTREQLEQLVDRALETETWQELLS